MDDAVEHSKHQQPEAQQARTKGGSAVNGIVFGVLVGIVCVLLVLSVIDYTLDARGPNFAAAVLLAAFLGGLLGGRFL